MSELRKDYLTDDYVVIAKERAKRPDQFNSQETKSDPSNCPFCPENENMLPGVIEESGNPWRVRAVPNKFRAVEEQGNPNLETDNEFYTYSSAFGTHEVIIETPKHGVEINELAIDHIVEIIKMYIKRIQFNISNSGIVYPALFKNKGVKAGASIAHSHSQLISYNIIPKKILEITKKSKEYFDSAGHCPYCNIIRKELNSYRHIYDDGRFFVYSPYASEYPMQFNLIPKRHLSSILDLNNEEITSLAENLKKYLSKLETIGNPSYNILFNNFYESKEYSHFEIIVAPRLTTWAGFEKLTGTIINPLPPEDAAKFYKE